MASEAISLRGTLESRSDFGDTPQEQWRYWHRELNGSLQNLKQFQKTGTKIVRRFLGGSKQNRDMGTEDDKSNFRLNLFHSNVVTVQSMLHGNLPQVNVSRRYNDANDDVGRVCALILERLLTNDVQDNGKEYTSVLRAVLQDRLLPGLGCARVRYDVQTKQDPETGAQVMSHEDAPVDYYHWRDVSWGWGRTFSAIPWIAFRSYMRKDAVTERFGEEVGRRIELNTEGVVPERTEEGSRDDETGPWKKAEVWEIWDKERRQVVWYSPGLDYILDTKPDPMGLSGFYPCPPFLLANQTTSQYVPTSDFSLAQDLYNEVDTLQTRISIITEAVKVVGLYDRKAEEISRMFKEGTDNDLIPVDNWAVYAEQGGIRGQVDWLPIKEIAETLLRLRELRDEAIGLLQQVTGMSDIMRGELGGQYEGVGQSELKAKFASVRIQALQDEFAQFASDLLQLKAEVIAKHFSPETIAKRANINYTWDMDQAQAAIQLLKSPEARLRVEVKPESLSMVDYAQLKQERVEYLSSIAGFLQAATPLIESVPTAQPFLLELLKWGLAGFKGAHSVESIVDKAIESANQSPPDEGGGEEVEKENAKTQGQMQLEQLKHQNALQLLQAKAQIDMQTSQQEAQLTAQEQVVEMHAELAKTQAGMQAKIAEIEAKMHADMQTTAVDTGAEISQNQAEGEMEVTKNVIEHRLEIDKIQKETEADMKVARVQKKLDPDRKGTDTKG